MSGHMYARTLVLMHGRGEILGRVRVLALVRWVLVGLHPLNAVS